MNIITINVGQGGCGAAPLLIGYAGEDSVDAVDFDFSAWAQSYGEGTISLELMRASDTAPYPAILTVDGAVARWTVSDVDTARSGPGVAQLVYKPTGATKKSEIYKFYVGRSLTEPGEDDPWGPIIERMEEILAEMQQQATAADQSAEDASGSARDAEAWALGERGGDPVPITDPTHENNAKYYAEQAGETAREFTEETAPAAVQAVNVAGQAQTQAVNAAGAAALDAIGTARSGALDAIGTARAGALDAIDTESQTAVSDIDAAKTGAVQDVNTAKTDAVAAVGNAQTSAVSAVEQEGTTQQAAVEQKGEDALAALQEYADLPGEVDDLKSAINALVSETEIWSDPIAQSEFTRMENKNFASGNWAQDKTGWSIVYYLVEESGTYKAVSSELSNLQIKLYNNGQILGVNYIKNVANNTPFYVEAGCLIAATAWSMTFTLSVTKDVGTAYTIPSISEEIKAEENNIFGDGWAHLPTENFSRNEWNSYTTATSRNYRVKYGLPLEFPRPVTIMSAPGFYIEIYKSDNTYSGLLTSYNLQENTPIKLNVRRITENQSEIADVETFASAVTISTPFAGIEKFADTFTDISMFERVGIGGDSYASGGGIISGIRPLTWGKNLERQAGITVDIYARSGESLHASTGWNYDETNGLPALLAGPECGLYWLAHGINSADSIEKIGTPADMEVETKPFTFYGQYVYAIDAIKSQFPNARIVLSTVTGSSYALWETLYANINTAIRNIAEFCQVPLIELIDDDFYKSIWYSNNIRSNHPTAMLCAGMAMANRRLLARCIMDNPTYFVNYGST